MRRRRPGHGDDRGAPLIELHVEEHGDGFPFLIIQCLGWSKWAACAQWPDYSRRRRVPRMLFPDALAASLRRFAVAETLAHLEHLVHAGRAVRLTDGKRTAYTR